MINANVDSLEKLIMTGINTKYIEVPPSEEEFISEAEILRKALSGLYPVSQNEFNEILQRLREKILIKMDVGIFINDREAEHKSWLPSRRAELDFFFWNRYKSYLEN